MTRFERSALAFLTKVLLRELPKDDKAALSNRRWRVEPIGQTDDIRAFHAKEISWHKIHFEDESSRYEIWNEDAFKNKNETMLKAEERPHNKIRITQINTNDMKVEDDDASYDIEMKSYDDVEIYSHKSRRRFKFKVVN
jgi:hypothetical protein